MKTGAEAKRSLEFNAQPNYRELFKKETDEIAASEMWRAGKAVRSLRVSLSPLLLYFSGVNDYGWWTAARV